MIWASIESWLKKIIRQGWTAVANALQTPSKTETLPTASAWPATKTLQESVSAVQRAASNRTTATMWGLFRLPFWGSLWLYQNLMVLFYKFPISLHPPQGCTPCEGLYSESNANRTECVCLNTFVHVREFSPSLLQGLHFGSKMKGKYW